MTAYSTLAPNAQNLVFMGGMMNVKSEWMEGLIENFRDQIQSFCKIWEDQGGNPDDLNFVIGFNSQKSVDSTNIARRELKTGEGDIVLHMNERERIEAFEKMADAIGAAGLLMFDEEKLGELFAAQDYKRQPFVGIAKRGYGPDDSVGLPICEGMQFLNGRESSLVLTLPAWEAKPVPETASTHAA